MAEDSLCSFCEKDLVIELDDSGDEDDDFGGAESSSRNTADDNPAGAEQANLVSDDVQLLCGCHFHWQCLFDACEQLHACPSCSAIILSGGSQLLCTLRNEGGIQEDYDLFPALNEHLWLERHPNERKAVAFLEFCRTGDVPALLELLADVDDPGEEDIDLFRYQYPLQPRMSYSALHFAVEGESEDVAWLLLYFASAVELQRFPSNLLHLAEGFGMRRPALDGKTDIRGLLDSAGRSPEDHATGLGSAWSKWIGKGLLTERSSGILSTLPNRI